MHTVLRLAAFAGLTLLSAGSALAGATVTFSQPERFSDIPFTPSERERVLKELGAHFDKLAAKLPPGQNLKVEILDVDLAGEVRHDLQRTPELRVLRGAADWPHMHLRYAVEQDGKVIKSGDAQLSDMNYLNHIGGNTSSGEFLRYEKRMIDTWFKDTVAAR